MNAKRACGECGKNPAAGHAAITIGTTTTWYCHDGESGPSCYTVALAMDVAARGLDKWVAS